MTVLIPERFGCGSKLELSELEQHVAACGLPSLRSFSVTNIGAAGSHVRSIDKVFQVGASHEEFARMAIAHANADILCGGAVTQTIDVGFEFGPDLDLSERLVLSRAVFEAANVVGADIGKCHSTFGSVTALTLAVSGERIVNFAKIPDQGQLLLTRKLGAMRDLYIAAMLSDHELREDATLQMGNDHSELIRQAGNAISFAADVSGFGLGGALREMSVGISSEIVLSRDKLPSIWRAGDLFPECLASGLGNLIGQANMSAKDHLRLSIREFCGPLILAVNTDQVDEVSIIARRLGFLDIQSIASFSSGVPELKIT